MTVRSLIILTLFTLAGSAEAAGLSTTMGRVFVKNVPVGSTVSLNALTGMSYKVTNTARSPEEVLVGVLVPAPDEDIMVAGYEPLPAGARVSLARTTFELAPGQQGASDILIYIPKDERHLEKKYQVSIWARNKAKGRLLAVGLKSRLLITVAPTLKSPEEAQKAREIIEDLNFHLTPFEIAVDGVPLGGRVDATAKFGKKFKIVNLSDKAFQVRFKSARQASAGLKAMPGVLDDVGFVRARVAEMTIEPNSIGIVPFMLDVPADENLAGKKARFILEAELAGYAIPVSAYGQVFVTFDGKTKESQGK